MRARTIRRWMAVAVMAGGICLSAAPARADVPPTITNQGRLFNLEGTPIDGALEVVFSIYAAQNDDEPLWSESHTILFEEGYYSVSLGSVVPFGDEVFDGSLRYFGITVGDEPELSPRSAIQSVPYALLAQDVNGDIHPTTVTINGTEVINENGEWVGPPTGLLGPTGPAGPTGPTGAAGAAGQPGPTGPVGPAGLAGAAGPVGPTGPQGAAGVAGAVGPTGPAGAMGAVGPTGPMGATGATGAVGATGPAGARSTRGAA